MAGIMDLIETLTFEEARAVVLGREGGQRELFDAMTRGEIGANETQAIIGASDADFAEWVTMEHDGRQRDQQGQPRTVTGHFGDWTHPVLEQALDSARTFAQVFARGGLTERDSLALREYLQRLYPHGEVSPVQYEQLIDLPDAGNLRVDLQDVRWMLAALNSANSVQREWSTRADPPSWRDGVDQIIAARERPLTLREVWAD